MHAGMTDFGSNTSFTQHALPASAPPR
jgi:hypothetical protein